MLNRFHPIPERYGRTDRQTDRQTDGQNCYINIVRQSAVSLLTLDKNSLHIAIQLFIWLTYLFSFV